MTITHESDPFSEFDEAPTNEAMAKLTALVEEYDRVQQWLEKNALTVERGKNRLQELEERLIPDVLQACGQTECKLTNGLHVSVKNDIYANIPAASTIERCKDSDEKNQLQERRDRAMQWIDENAPDVAKRKFEIAFGREDQKLADKFERDLAQRKRPVPVLRSISVDPRTLNKLVRDRQKESLPLPWEILGIYEATKATIKRIKG